MYFDVRAEVCNRYVDGLMHQAVPQLHATQTAVLRWSGAQDGDSALTTPAEVAACRSQIQSAFSPWLTRLHDLVALDALVNGPPAPGSATGEARQCHFDGDTGYSRLILAYLASNPCFEDMLAQTEHVLSRGKPDPNSDLNKVCKHLRAHAKPVSRATAR